MSEPKALPAVRIVATDSIHPYPNNTKAHSPDQIAEVVQSISSYGWTQPIVVDRNNVIVAGHGRHAAALAMGLQGVPVVTFEGTEEEARAYRIADNRTNESPWLADVLRFELGGLQEAGLFTGFNPDDIGKFIDNGKVPKDMFGPWWIGNAMTEGGLDVGEDDVPAISKDTKTARGEIWTLGRHRVMCGDSAADEDVDLLMGGAKADMVFTDPPYGVNMTAKNAMLNAHTGQASLTSGIHGDDLSVEDLKPIIHAAFKNIERILADKSCYYIASPQGGELGLMMMMMMMQDAGIPCRHMIIWVKNAPVFSMGRLDYDYQHEPILYGWPRNRTHHKSNLSGQWTKSVWHCDREPNKLHPTMKPVDLIVNALLNSTSDGMVCADLFGGSGSTLIACEKTNRTAYLMEIDPQYVDVILTRWATLTGQDPVREDGTKWSELSQLQP